MTLIAIAPTNSPAGPGINAIGANDRQVVSVEPKSGPAKWLTLLPTASPGSAPSCIRSATSSTITIALSISKPRAMISPVTDIWWIGISIHRMPASTMSEASGNAEPTTSELRQPIISQITAIRGARCRAVGLDLLCAPRRDDRQVAPILGGSSS